MRVSIAGGPGRPDVAALTRGLKDRLAGRGHSLAGDDGAPPATLVFNVTTATDPVAHWRRDDRGQFGVTLLEVTPGSLAGGARPADVLAETYPALIRTLANAVIAVDGAALALITPELGVRPLDGGEPADRVLDAILPLASARLAIENRVLEDLPPELRGGTEVTRQLAEGGRRLAALGLLPSPVRVEDLLCEADRRLLRSLYGLQQVSYGNLSAREGDLGFWMTGRGVDKGRLEVIGRDVLLVVGHDRGTGTVDVRVPPGFAEGRVSVDAIEHALLYEAFPGIGAIVHVHAWMDGVDATRQSWPCGTVELADEVLALTSRQPDPERAVVGLRNHGLTVTGSDLDDVFERIDGRLRKEVPAT